MVKKWIFLFCLSAASMFWALGLNAFGDADVSDLTSQQRQDGRPPSSASISELEELLRKSQAKLQQEEAKEARHKERQWQRRKTRYQDRRSIPARGQACYVTPEEKQMAQFRDQDGTPTRSVWQEWAQWYCRSVPINNPHKNMTHELFLQLKCLQQGLDAINVPSYVTGGAMIGLLTVGGMNIYEMDNDIAVASWLDFEELQDYWSDLPESDICRDMIIWDPSGNRDGLLRSCFGIRDRERDCDADACSRMYRPYSDVYLGNQVYNEELWMFDATDRGDLAKHIGNGDDLRWPKWQGENRNDNHHLMERYRHLFQGEGAAPFVNESKLQTIMQEKNWDREQAFEYHVFTELLAKERQVMSDGTKISVLRRDISEFICDYKYGIQRWWNYPDKNGYPFGRKILQTCNAVYSKAFNKHLAGDRRIQGSS